MNHHRYVHNHLVVNEFVAFTDIKHIVEVENLSPPFISGDDDLLELAFFKYEWLTFGESMHLDTILIFSLDEVDTHLFIFFIALIWLLYRIQCSFSAAFELHTLEALGL